MLIFSLLSSSSKRIDPFFIIGDDRNNIQTNVFMTCFVNITDYYVPIFVCM